MIISISGKKQSGKDTVGTILQCLTALYSKGDTMKVLTNNTIPDYQLLPFSDETSWEKRQFAGKLKKIVATLIGCEEKLLEDAAFKEKELGEEWRVWFWSHYKLRRDTDPLGRLGALYFSEAEALAERDRWTPNFADGEISTYILTPRKMLQVLGTDAGRNLIHPNIWVNALFADYYPTLRGINNDDTEIRKFPNWIITDVRFPNEATAIKQREGVIIRVNRLESEPVCRACGINKANHHYRHPFVPNVDLHESEIALDNYKDFDYVIDNNGTLEGLLDKVSAIYNQIKNNTKNDN